MEWDSHIPHSTNNLYTSREFKKKIFPIYAWGTILAHILCRKRGCLPLRREILGPLWAGYKRRKAFLCLWYLGNCKAGGRARNRKEIHKMIRRSKYQFTCQLQALRYSQALALGVTWLHEGMEEAVWIFHFMFRNRSRNQAAWSHFFNVQFIEDARDMWSTVNAFDYHG